MITRLCCVAAALLTLAGVSIARADIPKQTRINMAWQIALEGAGFSPGVIDGKFGRKSQMALTEYAARYFPELRSPYDEKVLSALKVNVETALLKYTVTAEDAAQVGVKIPADWNEKEKLDRMRYESLHDALAEKFHCSKNFLQTLNAGVNLAALDVGAEILVPNIRPQPESWKTTIPDNTAEADVIRVNLAEKTIRVFDKAGVQLALFHCSVAKDKAKLPDRDAKVLDRIPEPNYTFNPKHWPEVRNVDRILILKPGPRNPVGLCWIKLDLPGYGMHGTPTPELIGKTGSHGCFRLTNWDALRLASFARNGMTIKMINPERE